MVLDYHTPWKALISPRTKKEEASVAKAVGQNASIVETHGTEAIPTVKSVSEDEAVTERPVDELRSLNSFTGGENGRGFRIVELGKPVGRLRKRMKNSLSRVWSTCTGCKEEKEERNKEARVL